jgi:hypothetical protein
MNENELNTDEIKSCVAIPYRALIRVYANRHGRGVIESLDPVESDCQIIIEAEDADRLCRAIRDTEKAAREVRR